MSLALLDTAKDAAYHMSIGEAAIVAVISICIVMVILVIIAGILNGFNIVYKINQNKAEEQKKDEAVNAENIPKVKEVHETVSKTEEFTQEIPIKDETELIAVITAAIAASINTTTDRIVVRSIRKVGSWKNTALKENINRI